MANQTQLAEVHSLGKECTKCCVWKPFSEFHKCKKNKLGKHSWCKKCVSGDRKRRNCELQDQKYGKKEAEKRRKEWEKKQSAPAGFKHCFRCKRTKKVSDFHQGSKDTKLGLASYCRTCMAQWAKKRSASSPLCRLRVALNTAKGAARRKNLPCSITTQDLMRLWEDQRGKCFYTNVSMSYAGDRLPESVSIDRVDSSKGYALDNVVLCCNRVNLMKRTMSISELIRWCELILEGMEEVRDR